MAASSNYHATVKKSPIDGLWIFRVFANWTSEHPVLIARGAYRDWWQAFTQAAGTVRSFRVKYECEGPAT